MIEVITFRLRAGADVCEFLLTDGRVQTEVAYQCPGLLRRTIARDGDRWLVLQMWTSEQACIEGEQTFVSSAFGTTFMTFVDSSTVSVDRFGSVD